jgi:hypothetical protein
MIDPELKAELDAIYEKAAVAADAAEKARKYLFWTGVVSILVIVLPAIGLAFVIPQFINTYTTELNGITGGGF